LLEELVKAIYLLLDSRLVVFAVYKYQVSNIEKHNFQERCGLSNTLETPCNSITFPFEIAVAIILPKKVIVL